MLPSIEKLFKNQENSQIIYDYYQDNSAKQKKCQKLLELIKYFDIDFRIQKEKLYQEKEKLKQQNSSINQNLEKTFQNDLNEIKNSSDAEIRFAKPASQNTYKMSTTLMKIANVKPNLKHAQQQLNLKNDNGQKMSSKPQFKKGKQNFQHRMSDYYSQKKNNQRQQYPNQFKVAQRSIKKFNHNFQQQHQYPQRPPIPMPPQFKRPIEWQNQNKQSVSQINSNPQMMQIPPPMMLMPPVVMPYQSLQQPQFLRYNSEIIHQEPYQKWY